MTTRSTVRTRAVGAVMVASALLMAACAEEEPDAGGADTEAPATEPAGTEPTEETTPAATEPATTEPSGTEPAGTEPAGTDPEGTTPSTEPAEEGGDYAAFLTDYIGGTAGEASGDPYRIGFAHSSDFFPEGDVAADAAVQVINSELGGIGGRPLELVKCNITVPEDGAACGAQFANDESIDLVIGGLVLAGPADLYSALTGQAAAIIAAPLDVSDYLNPNAVAYNAGALGAGVGGALFVTEDLQPTTAALIVTDDVAGRGGESVLRPIVEAAGIELSTVFVQPTATAPEIAAAFQATGAETADVVSIGLFEQGCIAAYDALQTLGIEAEVVTTSVCWGNAMQAHLAEQGLESPFPNWNFSWFGFNPFVEDLEPSVAAYLDAMGAYGGADVQYSVAAPIVFDAVLSAAQVINGVGVDSATYETLDAGVRAFTGPSLIQSGEQACGIPPYVSICASEVGVYKHQDGEWIPQRSAPEGNPIDLAPVTRPAG